jgi:hypothetical protein
LSQEKEFLIASAVGYVAANSQTYDYPPVAEKVELKLPILLKNEIDHSLLL